MRNVMRIRYGELSEKAFFSLTEATVEMNGRTYVRHIVRHPGGSAVVAVDRERAVCVEQYRPALGRHVLEIPGGRPEAGESAEQTASRELYEETGLQAVELEPLLNLAAVPCFSDWRASIFLATRFVSTPQPRVDGELPTAVRLVSLDSIEDLISSGDLIDAKTIVGLFLARSVLRMPDRRGTANR